MQVGNLGSNRFHSSQFALRSLTRPAVGFLAVLTGCASFVSAAQAGLLEDIFGGGETPAASAMWAGHPPAPQRPRLGHAHRPIERPATPVARIKPVPAPSSPAPAQASAATGNVKPKPARFCDKSAPIADSTQALMRDATLKYGDVIVTDEGVRVFEGSTACPHAVSNFRTLAETLILSPGTRTALAQIEVGLKAPQIHRADMAVVATDTASR
jgi:hypothetical protein